MLLLPEEVKADVERSTMKVIERNFSLDLWHFFGFADGPGYVRMHQLSFIEA